MIEGHDQPCYYCKKPCDTFAASPSLWPLPLCHVDDPGKVKWHHTGCVMERLIENCSIEVLKERLKQLGHYEN